MCRLISMNETSKMDFILYNNEISNISVQIVDYIFIILTKSLKICMMIKMPFKI